MAKPNYHHAKKQKELARKSRQIQKEQRRTARAKPAGPEGEASAQDVRADSLTPPGASGG